MESLFLSSNSVLLLQKKIQHKNFPHLFSWLKWLLFLGQIVWFNGKHLPLTAQLREGFIWFCLILNLWVFFPACFKTYKCIIIHSGTCAPPKNYFPLHKKGFILSGFFFVLEMWFTLIWEINLNPGQKHNHKFILLSL